MSNSLAIFSPPALEILPLVHKINTALDNKMGAIIMFIAAQSGEGTTTTAHAYAEHAHIICDKEILIVTTHANISDAVPHTKLIAAISTGEDYRRLFAHNTSGIYACQWQGSAHHAPVDFWNTLRTAFDLIVIDAPAINTNALGIAFAHHSDCVVIVVEAERTRRELVENLRNTLIAAQGNILGIVLNKRQAYIPKHIYKKI